MFRNRNMDIKRISGRKNFHHKDANDISSRDAYKTSSMLVRRLENPAAWQTVKPKLLNLSKKYLYETIHPLVRSLANPKCQIISEEILLEIANDNKSNAYTVSCQLIGKSNDKDISSRAENMLPKIGNKYPSSVLLPSIRAFMGLDNRVIAEKIFLITGIGHPYEASQILTSALINPEFKDKTKIKELFKKVAQKSTSKAYKPLISLLMNKDCPKIIKETLLEIGFDQPYEAIRRCVKSITTENIGESVMKELEDIISTIFVKRPTMSMAGLISTLVYPEAQKTVKRLFYPMVLKYPCDGISLILEKFGYPEYHPVIEEILSDVAKNTPRITKQMLEDRIKVLSEAPDIPFLAEQTQKALEFYMNLPRL